MVTTNPSTTANPADTTTKVASYGGCGCAGGTVVTLTDEVGRRQRAYSDVLGRTWKTEVVNSDNSVYSATVNSYNARDQITQVRQYAGPEGSATYQDAIMTYDNYGRLKTSHTPEQDAGAVTTRDYNPDDTVQKITDARGANQTYSYNGRHLVNAITYSAPYGVTPTSNVSYGYDAAGNRTSMTDGLGSVSYSYNQLSHMTSETRQFNSLGGSYTLSYEYNLAGQLKKITDPTNVTINYNHDALGRANSITGENSLYGGVSTYASGMQYRASGGIKGLTYGNNYTLSVSYNARLQGMQFEVGGRPPQYGSPTVMKTNHQYHPDGRLKYAQDQLDERFDRAYSYDQIARLKEAYSGGESRDYVNGTSGSPWSGPYRQTYQFDAFNNMTQRDNRLWSRNDSFTATYTNHRRQGFAYDADGRLTQDDDLQYYYDAAGESIAVFDADTNKWLSYFRDGDGELIKRVETIFNPLVTTYYLRSSVLGRVVTELNQNGQKQKGYVLAGDQVLAEQESNVVTWKYTNPLTGSRGGASTNGFFSAMAEPDPMGVNLGFTDPFAEPFFEPPPEEFVPRLLGDSGSCGFNPNCTTCYLDGFEIGCDRAMHLLDIGAADLQVTLSNGRRATVPIQSHGLGLFSVWVRSYSDHPGIHDGVDPITGEPVDVASATLTEGHWQLFSFNFTPGQGGMPRQGGTPQNSPPFDREQIKQLVTEALGKGPCAEFAKSILDAVNSKKNPTLAGGDLAKIFETFLATGGDYTRVMPPGSAGYGNPIGNIMDKGGARIYLSPATGLQASFDANGTIAELFHLAGSKKHYRDRQLADAARAIPGYAALADERLRPQDNIYSGRYRKGPTESPDYGYSIYFHTIQRILCPVRGLSQ